MPGLVRISAHDPQAAQAFRDKARHPVRTGDRWYGGEFAVNVERGNVERRHAPYVCVACVCLNPNLPSCLALFCTTEKANRSFKQTVNAQACRHGRVETSIKLRKEKKEQLLKKRRYRTNESSSPDKVSPPQDLSLARVHLWRVIETIKAGTCNVEIVEAATASTKRIRKVLAATGDKTSNAATEVVRAGLLTVFINAAQVPDGDRNADTYEPLWSLKFELTWCINNLAVNGKEADILESAGSLDTLSSLTFSPNPLVRDQAIWAVGNIAGGDAKYREAILYHSNLMKGLTENLIKPSSISLLNNTVWTISNLLQVGQNSELVRQMGGWVVEIMHWLSKDVEGATAAETNLLTLELLHALRQTMKNHRDMIQNVVNEGFIDIGLQIIADSQNKNYEITGVAICCLATICGDVDVADSGLLLTISNTFLPMAGKLIQSSNAYVRRKACYLLGKIADGGEHFVSMMMSKNEMVADIIQMALSESQDVKQEAYWWIGNVLCEGTLRRDVSAVCSDMQVFQVLADSLKKPTDVNLVLRMMDGLENIFKLDLDYGEKGLLHRFQECDGVENLENLQHHVNTEVYEKALYLLDTYCDLENEEAEVEDEEMAPLCNEDSFAFGIHKKELFPATPFAFMENL
jgi:hypothetical protein